MIDAWLMNRKHNSKEETRHKDQRGLRRKFDSCTYLLLLKEKEKNRTIKKQKEGGRVKRAMGSGWCWNLVRIFFVINSCKNLLFTTRSSCEKEANKKENIFFCVCQEGKKNYRVRTDRYLFPSVNAAGSFLVTEFSLRI